jgi:hypothetical protein
MPGTVMYDRLDDALRSWVDTLVARTGLMLWPERRAALAAFHAGIARADPDDLRAVAGRADAAAGGSPVVDAVQATWDPAADPAVRVFRVVLTAWIERTGADPVTNPDQAVLYAMSHDRGHVRDAVAWLDAHPEHSGGLLPARPS